MLVMPPNANSISMAAPASPGKDTRPRIGARIGVIPRATKKAPTEKAMILTLEAIEEPIHKSRVIPAQQSTVIQRRLFFMHIHFSVRSAVVKPPWPDSVNSCKRTRDNEAGGTSPHMGAGSLGRPVHTLTRAYCVSDTNLWLSVCALSHPQDAPRRIAHVRKAERRLLTEMLSEF